MERPAHPEVTSVGARYVALAGPTAAGKTQAALAIAGQHACEIISVDSALVYRGMDIGTAKPTADELAAVPHHLINIRDPSQPYSAAEFASDARALIADITARGKLPLLVGGTMLYFKALFDGLDAMPRADPAVRLQIEREAQQIGWPAMHAALALADPVTAARLPPADSQRIARALEVFRLTGRPLSSFHTTKTIAAHARSTGVAGTICMKSGAAQRLLIALEPLDRSWLHQRIGQRFDAMLSNGFIEEVQALRARADLHADLPAMRCVGYRQAWSYLDAVQTEGANGTPPMSELREKAVAATRQLAKRQLTWLRAMPERRVVACDGADATQQVLGLVSEFVNGQYSCV